MNRRERLLATLRGQKVDRPAVCFYELNGLDEDLSDPDPFNIYNHPSWRPLIELTAAKTDRIVMRTVPTVQDGFDPLHELSWIETWSDPPDRRYTRLNIAAGKRVLTSLSRRDRDLNTTWIVEPLLKDIGDLRAYLALPFPEVGCKPMIQGVLEAEKALGETGIVMIDTPDPLCEAAQLFDMSVYLEVAFTEQTLFRSLLDRFYRMIEAKTRAVAEALPGRLWRLYGPEYASPPYLPPRLFRDYVLAYDAHLIEIIHNFSGYARIHCHGRLRNILEYIVATGCIALDPIEPPPQGDVSLKYVRERYGDQLVLFGKS